LACSVAWGGWGVFGGWLGGWWGGGGGGGGGGVEICIGQFFTAMPPVLCILVYGCGEVFAVGKNCHKSFEAVVKVCGC
jgi:hypothetical protein